MGSLPGDDALADVVADLEVGGEQVLRLGVDVVVLVRHIRHRGLKIISGRLLSRVLK